MTSTPNPRRCSTRCCRSNATTLPRFAIRNRSPGLARTIAIRCFPHGRRSGSHPGRGPSWRRSDDGSLHVRSPSQRFEPLSEGAGRGSEHHPPCSCCRVPPPPTWTASVWTDNNQVPTVLAGRRLTSSLHTRRRFRFASARAVELPREARLGSQPDHIWFRRPWPNCASPDLGQVTPVVRVDQILDGGVKLIDADVAAVREQEFVRRRQPLQDDDLPGCLEDGDLLNREHQRAQILGPPGYNPANRLGGGAHGIAAAGAWVFRLSSTTRITSASG